jgi:hypothetical protein
MVPRLTLTPDQENAIYNAVVSQHVKPQSDVPLAIGAPVPRPAKLPQLPAPDDLAIPRAGLLKYAMLHRDIIVVDSVEMRVVAIIRERTQP